MRPLGDIDVTMVNGAKERIPVYVEAEDNDTAVKLETLKDRMDSTKREIQTIRVKYQEP